MKDACSTYTSKDGEVDIGKLDVTVIYSLTENNELVISLFL